MWVHMRHVNIRNSGQDTRSCLDPLAVLCGLDVLACWVEGSVAKVSSLYSTPLHSTPHSTTLHSIHCLELDVSWKRSLWMETKMGLSILSSCLRCLEPQDSWRQDVSVSSGRCRCPSFFFSLAALPAPCVWWCCPDWKTSGELVCSVILNNVHS